MTITREANELRIQQGNIFADIDCIVSAAIINGEPSISKIPYKYVVVMSQDCDLEQDHRVRFTDGANNMDKLLTNVIVVPMYNYEHFIRGNHLADLQMKMADHFLSEKKSPNKELRSNNNPRYHYLEFDKSTLIVNSVVDFKHFFTVGINYLYGIMEDSRKYTIDILYRERLSQRFADYLSRIGLPDGTTE